MTNSYVMGGAPAEEEAARLRLLAEMTDGPTFERLIALGPLAGRRCIDVGTGNGSVARWLADRVGPTGKVVATDLNPSAVEAGPGVEVYRFDIMAETLEPESFDLVHTRSVLLHLADPILALRRLAAALRPGGLLLVEDSDLTTFRSVDPSHPAAADFDDVMAQIPRHLSAAGVDPTIGRRLPAMVAQLGLGALDTTARLTMYRGGTVGAELWKANTENILGRIADAAPDPAGRADPGDALRLKHANRALDDPDFLFWATLRVQSWGRRGADLQ